MRTADNPALETRNQAKENEMEITPQVGDSVRVGTGEVEWEVFNIGMGGIIQLISKESSMLRSEMLWNIEPY